MPSVMDMFRNIVSPTPPKDPSGANPNVPGKDTPVPDGTGPGAFPKAPDPKDAKSPLSGFADLWQNPIVDKNAPPAPSLTPSFNVDPAKLAEAAGKIDFAKVAKPELITAALKGDEAAFSQVLNSVVQTVYAQSAAATTRIVEAALARQGETILQHTLPAKLREHEAGLRVNADNPVFSNPAVAPLLETLKAQMLIKHPTASAEEISRMTKEYLTGVAGEIIGVPVVGSTGVDGKIVTGAKEQNWERFFDGEPTP